MTTYIYDTDHVFNLTLNGVSVWPYLVKNTLTHIDIEGSQIDTLDFILEDTTDALNVTMWSKVEWIADGTKLFGGFVVRAQPELGPGDSHKRWQVQCESYAALLDTGKRVHKSYLKQTVGYIITDLITEAGLSDISTTGVSAGGTVDSFVVDGDSLPILIDRLVQLGGQLASADWGWYIDPDGVLYAGLYSDNPSPFAIVELASADWSASFPPLSAPSYIEDATEIRNRITVRGGSVPSEEVTETFTGDGATTTFQLENTHIRSITSITLDGTLVWWGVDWYDSFNDFQCLVNFYAGTLRWDVGNEPTGTIQCTYRYDSALEVIVANNASYTTYGRWFDYEITDRSISTEQAATDIANAILRDWAIAPAGGELSVPRLGLKAGQLLGVTYAPLSLNTNYPIRKVVTTLDDSSLGVISTVRFGGRYDKLSTAIASMAGRGGSSGQSGAEAYGQPTTPTQVANVQNAQVDGAVQAIDPRTTFINPTL